MLNSFLNFFIVLIFGSFVILSNAATIRKNVEFLRPDYDINAWPYVVSIQRNNEHACIGTFVNEKAILTTSKCVKGFKAEDLTIEESSSKWSKGNEYLIGKIIYGIKDLHEDLAILFVKNPINHRKYDNLKIVSHKNTYGGLVFHWSSLNKICPGTVYVGRAYYEISSEIKTFTAITSPLEKCSGELGSPLILRAKGGPYITGVLTDKSQCSDEGFKNYFIDLFLFKEKIESIINSDNEEKLEESTTVQQNVEVKIKSTTEANKDTEEKGFEIAHSKGEENTELEEIEEVAVVQEEREDESKKIPLEVEEETVEIKETENGKEEKPENVEEDGDLDNNENNEVVEEIPESILFHTIDEDDEYDEFELY